MKITQHTSGDWRIGKRGGKYGVGAIYGPKGEEIAVFSGMLSPDEELANARLMAAAPLLLAALKDMLPIFDAFTQDELSLTTIEEAIALLPSAKAAIAKATQL